MPRFKVGPLSERALIGCFTGFVIGVAFCWQQLDEASGDGLTLKEWVVTVFAALVISVVVARLMTLGIAWLDRHGFGDEDDE